MTYPSLHGSAMTQPKLYGPSAIAAPRLQKQHQWVCLMDFTTLRNYSFGTWTSFYDFCLILCLVFISSLQPFAFLTGPQRLRKPAILFSINFPQGLPSDWSTGWGQREFKLLLPRWSVCKLARLTSPLCSTAIPSSGSRAQSPPFANPSCPWPSSALQPSGIGVTRQQAWGFARQECAVIQNKT